MKKRHVLVALAAGGIALAFAAAPAHADALYFQGFESNTSGWVPDSGTTTGAITRVPSGTAGIPAFRGSYYAEVTNAENAYTVVGYGTGGYTYLSSTGLPTPYPGWSFSQSIAVYVDVTTPKDSSGEGFDVDMSPSGPTGSAYADEQGFQVMYTGSSVNVQFDNRPTLAPIPITTSGWYVFQTTYSKGSTPTSIVSTNMNIYDSSGALVGTRQPDNTLVSADLGGPGYIWLPQWQNGFSNDHLAIDDVRADVPEPSSIALLGAGLLALGFAVRRRRHSSDPML